MACQNELSEKEMIGSIYDDIFGDNSKKRKIPDPPIPLSQKQCGKYVITHTFPRRLIKLCDHDIPIFVRDGIMRLESSWIPKRRWIKTIDDTYELRFCDCCMYINDIIEKNKY